MTKESKLVTITLIAQDELMSANLESDGIIELTQVRAMLQAALAYISILEERDPTTSGH